MRERESAALALDVWCAARAPAERRGLVLGGVSSGFGPRTTLDRPAIPAVTQREKFSDDALTTRREDIWCYRPSLPQGADRALSIPWAASKRLEDYRAQLIPMPRHRGVGTVHSLTNLWSNASARLADSLRASVLLIWRCRNFPAIPPRVPPVRQVVRAGTAAKDRRP
ncbi:MAG: hypothetical protein JWM61_2014 [Micrococcaceae bacterium]|nr:hypothetical protein [Micrococcaceae bacterium]